MRQTAGTWVLLLASSAAARDDGPELAAPADPPPAAEAAPDPAPAPRPRTRPLPPRPRTPTRAPEPTDDLPPLVGPAEMVGPDPRLRAPARATAPGRSPRPLVLESVPREALEFGPGPGLGEAAADGDARPARPSDPPGASRRTRLFGRLPGMTPAPLGRPRSDAGDEVIVEPKSDPAADAALKRLIERQIRESLGDKVRSAEVLVVNRRVIVQARAARFWQRRALRRAIEGLPALAGSRATVYVDE